MGTDTPTPPSWGQADTPVTGQHVLVVEDDTDIRMTLVDLLREAGYVVDQVPDGKPALQRLHNSAARLVVILDWNMPGMDGKAVLQPVAAHDILAARHAYILLTSNERTLPLDFALLLTRLRAAVIAKPFNINTLLTAVAHAAARLAG